MLGIWMWADSLIGAGADAVFDHCAQIDVTDVFFLSKGLSGRCAFPTPLAPPMHAGRDLLSEAISAAHGRGIRLHAWFTSAQDAAYCAEHPDSGLVHFTKGPSNTIVSIADRAYVRYIHAIIGDLLERYPVDGLHLDYIRYNHLLYGWSESDTARYEQFGADVSRIRRLVERSFYGEKADATAVFDAYRNGDADAQALAKARISDVCRFADAVLEDAREARRDLILSAAFMPEGAYDTVFSDLHYGQNYRALCGRFDLILPMAYSVAYGMDADWVKKVTQGAISCGKKVLTGLHAYDGATGLTLGQDLRAALSVPEISGVCLFRYGTSLLATLQGKTLDLFNPTDRTCSKIILSDGAETISLPVRLEPGQSARLPIPFEVKTVRAWSGDAEVCVFLAGYGRA